MSWKDLLRRQLPAFRSCYEFTCAWLHAGVDGGGGVNKPEITFAASKAASERFHAYAGLLCGPKGPNYSAKKITRRQATCSAGRQGWTQPRARREGRDRERQSWWTAATPTLHPRFDPLAANQGETRWFTNKVRCRQHCIRVRMCLRQQGREQLHTVTLERSPPKAAALRCTHRSKRS
jgi:hypothetical protein